MDDKSAGDSPAVDACTCRRTGIDAQPGIRLIQTDDGRVLPDPDDVAALAAAGQAQHLPAITGAERR
jgi:hypothetical protein